MNKDINSTEKLLSYIKRAKTVDEASLADKPSTSKYNLLFQKLNLSKYKKHFFLFNLTFSKSNRNIGIDLGHWALRLVMLEKSGNDWKLIKYAKYDYPIEITKESPQWIEFLSSKIRTFAPDIHSYNVWAIMSSYNVEVRHFNIPSVSSELIEDAIFWTLKKEISFNETESLYDFEIHGEIIEQNIKKIFVSAFVIPKTVLQSLKTLYAQINIRLTGVLISSLAIQNIFRTKHISRLEQESSHIFIGNEFSRIDIYSNGTLTLTRDIKTGIKSFCEIIVDELGLTNVGNNIIYQDIITALSIDDDSQVCLQINNHACTKEEIFNIIKPALDRFIRQIERTFSYYNSVAWKSDVKNIFISSVIPVNKLIISYIAEQLNVTTQIFNPLQEKLMDLDITEQIAIVPAYAAALSSNTYTPNFIYTYFDKKKDKNIKKTKNNILKVFIITAFICSAFLGWELVNIKKYKSELASLNAQYQSASAVVSKSKLIMLAAQNMETTAKISNYGKKYMPISAIAEISQVTPKNINLLYLRTTFASADNASTTQAECLMEGILRGQQKLLDSLLTSYITKLEESAIFSQVSIIKKDIELLGKEKALRFLIKANIGANR